VAASAAKSTLTVRKPPLQVGTWCLFTTGSSTYAACCLFVMQAESESESGGHEENFVSYHDGISAIAISCSMWL